MTDALAGRVGDLLPTDPETVGPYRVVGRLGQGGMGTVYRATAPDGRAVAVKVVRAELAAAAEFRRRFRSEVERARQVPPFCTAEVLDADPDCATPYLVVEYVDGPDLGAVVAANGPLSAANLHALAIGVATALAAIHGAGVMHRDLKPRNVLLAPGSPKVIDFGIARAFDASERLTLPEQLLGTVSYMAPERFEPGNTDAVGPAADVFAWGAVIAYAGTGREPFLADSLVATATRILTQPPDLAGLPPALHGLVSAALAKDPASRPTARALLNRLLTLDDPDATMIDDTMILDDRPLLRAGADAARTGRRAGGRWARRGALVAALVAALVVVATVTVRGADGWRRAGADRPPRTPPSPAASAADPLVGDWIGELRQSFGSAQPMSLHLGRGGASGAVSYPRLACRGTLTVRQRTSDRIVLDEHITAGSCTKRGQITLWPTGPATMLLDYRSDSGQYTAHASMTRR